MEGKQRGSVAELAVRNIGGIDRTEVVFESGVTVLAGRNATNRTSLLQAVMAVLGSDDVSVKADADEATVELAIGGETYSRTFERQSGTVQTHGNTYLDDSTVSDLFAFLLESNDARRAVVREENLRDIIMEPIDTEEIQAEIERLLEERRRVSAKLDEFAELKERLPALESERTQLQQQIEETRAELEAVEANIETHDADVKESRGEQEEVEAKLEELRETRSDLEDVRYNLETEQESLESLRAEKHEVEREHEELPETPTERIETLAGRIDSLRAQKQELERELNEIQSVVGFNQERLADEGEAFTSLFDDESGPVTNELLPEERLTCWTCGSEVEKEQIETTVDRLQQLSQEMVSKIAEREDALDELREQRETLGEQQRRREELENRRATLEDEVEKTKARIESYTDRRDALRDEVEAIEAKIDSLESDAYDEVLDLHKEANQLEYQLGQTETDLERVEENITSIEERLSDEDRLKTRREEVSDSIEEHRTRIERVEREAIEKFNDHMETVLDLLEYENLTRIWLERRETTVRDGRETVTEVIFDLHIVRKTDSGATYEDTVHNLSESEREVTGLIFALSGYLVHDVYETVPFMLLDSVEALDTTRVAALVEYLADFSEYLVVAVLPEYDDALPDSYARITEI